QLVRLVHHRNDESRVEVHGDADVDVPAVDDVVAGDGGVDPRELLEHPGDGDGHEGGVADLHALLFPALLVLAPDAVDAREVHLDERVDVGRDALGQHQDRKSTRLNSSHVKTSY